MLRTKNTFFWIFLDWNSKKSLSYLKSTHSNLSKCKVWCKTKIPKFGTKNVSFGYFWTGSWKWYCYIWNQHPRIFLIANFREKMKMPKFGTKNVLFGYFWAIILTNYCHIWNQTLKFVKNGSLSHIVNFGIGSAFSKGPGSASSEGPGLDPAPLYQVCRLYLHRDSPCSLPHSRLNACHWLF